MYVICTDSLSSLQAIEKNTIEQNIGKQIIETLLPLKNHIQLMLVPSPQSKGKGKVFYGQEPPSGESTTTGSGVNYQLLSVMH